MVFAFNCPTSTRALTQMRMLLSASKKQRLRIVDITLFWLKTFKVRFHCLGSYRLLRIFRFLFPGCVVSSAYLAIEPVGAHDDQQLKSFMEGWVGVLFIVCHFQMRLIRLFKRKLITRRVGQRSRPKVKDISLRLVYQVFFCRLHKLYPAQLVYASADSIMPLILLFKAASFYLQEANILSI